MTPIKIGLALLVIILFCYKIEGISKKEIEKIIGGFAALLLFLDIIWAIFYYINY